jgi:flagellin-like hook-associated protein FlgL
MSASTPLNARFFTRAQGDVRRITSELGGLQAQIASGAKANTLQGFGGASSRILSASSMRAATDSRASVVNQLEARFGVQSAALGQVSDATQSLALTIREAISANDGRGVSTELELAFNAIVGALNETWNGQPMFGGERQDGSPVKITSLDELAVTTQPEDMFDEASRHQIIDLGEGAPIKLAAKASELSTDLFNTLRQLKHMLDGAGGTLGSPMTGSYTDVLMNIAADLDGHAKDFVTEEGRTGQLQERFAQERGRLTARSDLLSKEIGDQTDADLAEVSIRLNTLLAQYEAAAKTFAELSQLSLLKYI